MSLAARRRWNRQREHAEGGLVYRMVQDGTRWAVIAAPPGGGEAFGVGDVAGYIGFNAHAGRRSRYACYAPDGAYLAGKRNPRAATACVAGAHQVRAARAS